MASRLTAAAAVGAAVLLGATAPGAAATTDPAAPPNTIEFSTARGDAPKLQPGMHQTAAPTGNTQHYASITRPKGGSVTVAIFGSVDATITTADGQTDCSTGSSGLDAEVTDYTFVSADATETERQSYLSDDCKSATHLILQLSADEDSDESASAKSAPLRFAVTVEPKVTDAGSPAPESEQDKIEAPSRTTSGQLTLSDELDAPTTVTAGKSYAVALTPGTIGVARVRVGWGQRLAASIDAPRNGTNVAPPSDLGLVIDAFSPQWSSVGGGSRSASLYKQDAGEETAGTYTAPVSAANREISYSDAGDVGTDHAQWTTVAGWYYIIVLAQPDDDDKPPSNFTLPARLNIEVTGKPTAGPKYAAADGSAVAAPPATELSQGGNTDSGSSTTTVLRIAGTAIVLVVAAAAVALLLRRRA